MEFNRLVSIRRSCRSYTEDIVYEADLREMIKAAQMAPTWKNSQTGRYYAALSDEGIANVFNFNLLRCLSYNSVGRGLAPAV